MRLGPVRYGLLRLLDCGLRPRYDTYMNENTLPAVPVFASLEELLAACCPAAEGAAPAAAPEAA